MSSVALMGKLAAGEEVVPDRPELRYTVAERLAAMRADAAFALWAVRFGPGAGSRKVLREWDPGQAEEPWYQETTLAGAANRMWLACRRPDWLLDAVALSSAFGAGNATHRKLVAFLCRAVEQRAAAALTKRQQRALKLALSWARQTAASVLVLPVQEVVGATEDVQADVAATMRRLHVCRREAWDLDRERAAYLDFGAAAGAYFAARTAFDPRCAATVGSVLALLATAGASTLSDAVCAEVREVFDVPAELRGEEQGGAEVREELRASLCPLRAAHEGHAQPDESCPFCTGAVT